MAVVEPSEKQLQWNLKALALAEDSQDERARNWKGSLYNNIGWTYFDQEHYEEALAMFEKALKFREEQGDPATIRIAKWCIAKALRMMDHTEEALEMQKELLQEYEAAGQRSGYVFEEIAECMLVLDQEQEAQPWFAAAYQELSRDPWVAGEQDRLNRLKELGKVTKFGT